MWARASRSCSSNHYGHVATALAPFEQSSTIFQLGQSLMGTEKRSGAPPDSRGRLSHMAAEARLIRTCPRTSGTLAPTYRPDYLKLLIRITSLVRFPLASTSCL